MIDDLLGPDLETGQIPIEVPISFRALNIIDSHLLEPSLVEEQLDCAIPSSMTFRNNIEDKIED